jgi:uncharacterized protein YkwD
MKYIRVFSSIAVGLFILNGCGTGKSFANASPDNNSAVNSNPYPAPSVSENTKEEYLRTINEARTKQQDCGSKGIKPAAPALIWSEKLYKAAYEHSNDMAESNTFSHDGSGTDSDWTGMDLGGKHSTFIERIENNSYIYSAAGENITAATNRNTAQKAIDSWIASDGHCANLMNPAFTEVGMAHIEKFGTTYIHYWTQNFGKSQ